MNSIRRRNKTNGKDEQQYERVISRNYWATGEDHVAYVLEVPVKAKNWYQRAKLGRGYHE